MPLQIREQASFKQTINLWIADSIDTFSESRLELIHI